MTDRDRAARLTQYEEAVKALSALLYDADPMGWACRGEAPTDEYQDEAVAVLSSISKSLSESAALVELKARWNVRTNRLPSKALRKAREFDFGPVDGA